MVWSEPGLLLLTTDTDSTSSTDISSASCLGKVRFKTLDAQAYLSYDLNFAGKPEEWTRTFYNSLEIYALL